MIRRQGKNDVVKADLTIKIREELGDRSIGPQCDVLNLLAVWTIAMPNQVVRREADRQQIRNLIRAQLLILNRRPRQIGQMVVGEGGRLEFTVEFRPRLRFAALQDVREDVIFSLVS